MSSLEHRSDLELLELLDLIDEEPEAFEASTGSRIVAILRERHEAEEDIREVLLAQLREEKQFELAVEEFAKLEELPNSISELNQERKRALAIGIRLGMGRARRSLIIDFSSMILVNVIILAPFFLVGHFTSEQTFQLHLTLIGKGFRFVDVGLFALSDFMPTTIRLIVKLVILCLFFGGPLLVLHEAYRFQNKRRRASPLLEELRCYERLS